MRMNGKFICKIEKEKQVEGENEREVLGGGGAATGDV